jgi:hypothetical protein
MESTQTYASYYYVHMVHGKAKIISVPDAMCTQSLIKKVKHMYDAIHIQNKRTKLKNQN